MKTLNILYVDEPAAFNAYEVVMRRPATLRNGSPVPIQVDDVPLHDGASTPSLDDAYSLISESPDKWHIVVVDVLWGDDENQRDGAGLISRIRSSFPHLAVIGLTTGGSGAVEAATDAGAHAVVLKRPLSEEDGERWLKTLRTVLAAVGQHLSPFDPDTHKAPFATEGLDDLPLRAVVDDFGWQRLWEAVFEVNERTPVTIDAVEFVAPGLSGAAVLRVVARVVQDAGDEIERRFLLKASRTAGDLEAEVAGGARARDLGVPFALLRSKSVTVIDDWSFIAYDFQDRATTLRAYVPGGPRVEQCTREIAKRLRSSNRSSVRTENLTEPFVSLRTDLLRPSRRARVLLAIEELAELPRHFSLPVTFDAERLRSVLGSTRIDGIELAGGRQKTIRVLSHGDLHGGNCLVDEYDRPILVDPANVRLLHWASDLARLRVDLALTTLFTDHRVHDWDTVETWVAQATHVGPGSGAPDGPRIALENLDTGLHELGTELGGVTGVVVNVPFEVDLALAFEYLRAGYRKGELTVQGRVTALCAADIHVARAVAAFDGGA